MKSGVWGRGGCVLADPDSAWRNYFATTTRPLRDCLRASRLSGDPIHELLLGKLPGSKCLDYIGGLVLAAAWMLSLRDRAG